MKTYAVAYMNFMDNTLTITFHQADTWKDALAAIIAFDVDNLSNDIEIAKSEAFDGDWMFDVKEIPK